MSRKILDCIVVGAIACFICAPALGQPSTLWTRTFGGTGYDWASSVQQTTDGGFIMAGGTDSYGNGNEDFYLVKTDASGNQEWFQAFGGANYDWCMDVRQTTDGGFILAGTTESYGAGNYDFWLIKTDALGDTVWTHTFGGSLHDMCESVQQTADGGYILLGSTGSYGAGANDVWLIKTTGQGDSEWTRTFGGTSSDFAYDVQQTADGGYIITGQTGSYSAGSYPVWLIKTDALGNEVWNHTFGEGGWGNMVRQTADEGYIIAGATNSGESGDVCLIKTDDSGIEEWNHTFGGIGWDEGFSVQQTPDGGYIVAGATASFGAGSRDVWLIKTDASGIEEWDQTFGGSGWDCGYSIQQTADGGYIVAGETDSYGAGSRDVWLIRLGSPTGLIEGNVIPTLEGVTVDIICTSGMLSTLTDASGHYSFSELDPGTYTVQLVVPLGFTADRNDVAVSISAGQTQTVDFTLTAITTTNTARCRSYWRHQVNGNGTTDYTQTEMLGLAQEIFDHFYGNPIYPIQISGVTYGDPAQPLGISDLQAMLNNNQGGSTMYQRACQEYLALLLNLVSNKVGQLTLASDDGVNHSQAVIYIHQLMGINNELAKDIAETLNNAQMLASGTIPLSTPSIIFGEGFNAVVMMPAEFSFSASPNPFNPTTAISFNLPVAEKVNLSIYDISGRLLATLVDGWREAGMHEVTFDGSGLASGVYFYKIEAEELNAVKKLILSK